METLRDKFGEKKEHFSKVVIFLDLWKKIGCVFFSLVSQHFLQTETSILGLSLTDDLS